MDLPDSSLQATVLYPEFDEGRDRKFTDGFGIRLQMKDKEEGRLPPELAFDLVRGRCREVIDQILEHHGMCTFNVAPDPQQIISPKRRLKSRHKIAGRAWHQDRGVLYHPTQPWPYVSDTGVTANTAALRAIRDHICMIPVCNLADEPNVNRMRKYIDGVLAEGSEYQPSEDMDQMFRSLEYCVWVNGYSGKKFLRIVRDQLARDKALHLHRWEKGSILTFSHRYAVHACVQRLFSGNLYAIKPT